MAHQNYPHKLIHKYPTILVEPGDLHGMWYQALYESAIKYPDKAAIPKLYLTVAYRYMIRMFDAMNALKHRSPSEWNKTSLIKRKINSYYEDFYIDEIIRNEFNMDDEDEDVYLQYKTRI